MVQAFPYVEHWIKLDIQLANALKYHYIDKDVCTNQTNIKEKIQNWG